MARMSELALLWFSLLYSLTAGHVTTTTTTQAPSSTENGLAELHSVKRQLDSLQRVMYPETACGSNLELVAVKRLLALELKVEALDTRQKATEAQLAATDTSLQSSRIPYKRNRQASTFVRWGRKACPNGTDLVYSGISGGSRYSHTGAAANPLCLTLKPETDGAAVPPRYALLYGAEYYHIPDHQDHDVPCSVCRASQSTTIMLPGTQTCPKGWTTQYAGYLTAGYWNFAGTSQYVCLDKDVENADGGVANQDGYLFSYTVAKCGSLPCPPYEDNKVVLCAVCSK